MKALLIADSETSVQAISHYIKPYSFDIIRYRSALKAIDNIEEIAPDAVFISTGDFPRHWKTIVQYIRADTGKDTTVVILLINNRFTAEDADKAAHIGVQAIISETAASPDDEHKLLEVFSRYRHITADECEVDGPHIGERAVFMFTNPHTDTIITGTIETLSNRELRFKPDTPSATVNLVSGDILDQCSLKLDSSVLAPQCRILRNNNRLSLEFVDPGEKDRKLLAEFISGAK